MQAELCHYKMVWTDEVGDIPVCQVHGNNSKHKETVGEHRPCITIDPWTKKDFEPGGLGFVSTHLVKNPKTSSLGRPTWIEIVVENTKVFEDEADMAKSILRENHMPCGNNCVTPEVCPRLGICGLTGKRMRRKYIDVMPWAGPWPWSPRCRARKTMAPTGYFGRCELKPHDSGVEHALERGMDWVRWSDGVVRVTPPDYIRKWVAE